MKNTSCPRVSFDFEHRFLPPVYILVFIIGLLSNGWGLKSLMQKWKELRIINVFVLNLGLADILYLLTLPFLMVYYFMKSKWIFGDAFCKITRFCFSLNLYGSIGFLTCISVYRYLSIVHPVRMMGRITVTHSVAISVLVWLLVSVQSLPNMFYSKTFGNKPGKCYDTTDQDHVEDYLNYSLGWTLTGFCIPFLITLGCYGHVIVVLCRTNTTDKDHVAENDNHMSITTQCDEEWDAKPSECPSEAVVQVILNMNMIFGDAFCKITRFCFSLNLYGSIGFLTCISVYRYLTIVHPVKARGRLTLTHSVAISVLVWLLVSVQSLPNMFYSKTFGNNTRGCYDTTGEDHVEDYLKYSLGWTLTGFCIPFLITLGCYGHIGVALWTMKRSDKVQKQRSLKLLFILILLFSVCYIPYHVFKNLNLRARVLLKQGLCREWFNGVYIAYQISRGLVCLNSAFNPLVYLHGNDDIPAQLRQLLQRARQAFSRLSLSNCVPVVQITDEV